MALNITTKPAEKQPDIRRYLHRAMAASEPGRPAIRLHASDVTKQDPEFCARSHALRAMLKTIPPELVTAADRHTFDLGIEMQERNVHRFAEEGLAVGDWKCLHCGAMHRFCKRPFVCQTQGCGHKRFRYEEVRVTSPKTLISNGLDTLLDLKINGKHTIVEQKTMQKDDFKKLVAPIGEHRLRTSIYLSSVKEAAAAGDENAKRINSDAAVILYTVLGGWGDQEPAITDWMKGGKYKDGTWSPFKQFWIKRDEKLNQPYVERALQYKGWKDGGPLPPRCPDCPNMFSKRAKKCDQLAMCFGGKYD